MKFSVRICSPLPVCLKRLAVLCLRGAVVLAASFHVAFAPATEQFRDPKDESTWQPAALDPLIRPYPPELTRTLRELKAGVDAYSTGRYEESLKTLPDEASSEASALDDYVLFYRARNNLMLERAEEALKYFRLLLKEHPDSPLYQDAVLGEGMAQLRLREPQAALASLQDPRLGKDSDTLYYQARALEDSGEREKAMKLYLEIYCGRVNSESAGEARQRLLTLYPRALSGANNYQSLLVRADNLIRSGQYREARTLLVHLGGVRVPDEAGAQKRLLLYGETEYHLMRTSTALSYLRRIRSADPELRARAVYLEGACHRRLKQIDSLLKARDEAVRLYPASRYTERLMEIVAANYDVSNDSVHALEAYRSLYESFPRGVYAERALWRSSVFSYVRKEYEEALRGFWKYLQSYPEPEKGIPALYWMGRCYQKLGDTAHASYLFHCTRLFANDSYYGLRAREAERAISESGTPAQSYGGMAFEQVADAARKLRPEIAAGVEPSAQAANIIERARRLAAAELTGLALSELRWGIHLFPAEKAISYVMARVFELRGDYYGVISALHRAFPDYSELSSDSLPKEVWELLFPVKYWPAIYTQARKWKVDPNLVLAVIRQESAFKPNARSAANARGLMQVLPSTGRRIARKAGVTRFTIGKLHQPEPNIAIGTHFLSALLNHYDGTEELALAAYSAGDTRVDRWQQEFGTEDLAEFVERIPFSETRGYVMRVLTNKAHYAHVTAAARPD